MGDTRAPGDGASSSTRTKRPGKRPVARYGPSVQREVRDFFAGKGWAEWTEGKHRDDQWNLFWKTCRVPERYRLSARANQVINKVSSQNSITSKDQLAKNMRLMRARYGTAYGFTPMTWVLPRQMAEVETALKRAGNGKGGSKKAFICKPARLSRGRGIFLFKTASELRSKMTREDATLARQKAAKLRRRAEAKKGKKAPIGSAASAGSVGSVGIWVVQRYISRPCLLRGRKFDIRTYALVPSTWPLLALVYRRGFCRLGTAPYAEADHNNLFAHLTNFTINKKNAAAAAEQGAGGGAGPPVDLAGACKLSLEAFFEELSSRGADADRVWSDMKGIMLKAIAVLVGECSASPNSFELLGFDIMLDDSFRCHLIEVNMEPSLGMKTSFDAKLKTSLLNDMYSVLRLGERAAGPSAPTPKHQAAAQRLSRRLRALETRGDTTAIEAMVKGYGGCFGVDPAAYGEFEQVFPFDAPSMRAAVDACAAAAEPSAPGKAQRVRPIQDIIVRGVAGKTPDAKSAATAATTTRVLPNVKPMSRVQARREVEALLRRYNPAKVAGVQALMKRHVGKEQQLIDKIRAKYASAK